MHEATRFGLRGLAAWLLGRLARLLWPAQITVAHTLLEWESVGWRILLVEERHGDGSVSLVTLAVVEPGGRKLWLMEPGRKA